MKASRLMTSAAGPIPICLEPRPNTRKNTINIDNNESGGTAASRAKTKSLQIEVSNSFGQEPRNLGRDQP